MSYMDTYKKWCTDSYFDEETRKELLALQGNDAEIEDRFYRQLEFGTGGLRGVIGAGTNRMNIYTVRQATQGLANYIISQNGQDKGVAIAYDSRIMSPEFSDEAALCLNANGIKTYRFESLRPTPELSFSVRELGCIAGIVITASHNPREYNGYKVYWEDGAQITPPHDKNILAEVAKVTDFSQVKTMLKSEAEAAGLYHTIGKEMDDRYMEELKKQSIHPEIIKAMAKDIRIVYTPLHGTGNLPVRRVLKELGFETIEKKELELTKQAMDGLSELPHVHIIGSEKPENHTGIVSFTIEQVHPHDVSEILAADGIDVRAGHHCAQPLLTFLKVYNTTRASFMFYNTTEEVDAFVKSVAQVRRRMGYGE